MPSSAAPSASRPIRLRDDAAGAFTTCFFSADLPCTCKTVEALGHDPNGYFWEKVVRWLVDRGKVPDLQTDPECATFYAYGPRGDAEALANGLAPYLTDDEAITALLTKATAAGFDLDG